MGAALLAFGSALAPAWAHDLWLQPERDPANAGAVLIRAVVGASFPRAEEARPASDYRDARVRKGSLSSSLTGTGKDATEIGRVSGAEPFFVTALGPIREIDLSVKEAREYLESEVGLDEAAIAALLREREKVHETYSRILKSLVVPPGAGSVPEDPGMGLPLELRLLRYERDAGGRRSLAVRLTKDDQPLASASVRIVGPAGKTITARTDAKGVMEALVDSKGPVLIAFIEVSGSGAGRYQTHWTNLAIFDGR